MEPCLCGIIHGMETTGGQLLFWLGWETASLRFSARCHSCLTVHHASLADITSMACHGIVSYGVRKSNCLLSITTDHYVAPVYLTPQLIFSRSVNDWKGTKQYQRNAQLLSLVHHFNHVISLGLWQSPAVNPVW
jgi:hypothetical protein